MIAPMLPYDDLRRVLSARNESQVIRWLNDRGIEWDTDAQGRPIVHTAALTTKRTGWGFSNASKEQG